MENPPISTDYRSILRVAIPMSLGAFIQFIVVFTDNFFVAKLDGKAMSAVSYIGLAYVTLVMITNGMSSAIQITVARRMGENQTRTIPTIVQNGLIMSIFIAALQFTLLYYITPIVLPNIIHDESTVVYMNEFIAIRSWGFWVYTPLLMLQGYWTGIAKTRPILFAMLITSLTNILLDYLLVQGNLGFPAMGVSGAALATLIAEFFAFLYLSIITYVHLPSVFQLPWKMNWEINKKITQLGMPIVFQMLIALGVWLAFYTLVENRGNQSLQSAFIVRNMYMLCWVSVMGFSSATRTYVSTLLAEKSYHQLNPTITKMIGFNILGVLLLSHGLWLYPEWIARQFSLDPEVITLTVQSMYIILPAVLIYCCTSILLAVVEGSGFTMAGFWIEVITSLGYITFITWAVYCTQWEVPLLWTADYVYFVLLGICSSYFLLKKPWRYKSI
jgi:putative MATE family efflux protein